MFEASPTKDAAWPPKSPRDLLLNTPGGRKRLEERRNRIQTSPSPSRRTPLSQLRGRADNDHNVNLEDASEEEEDEETLQLKLAAIEAKLKLRKLQKARSSQDGAASSASRSTESTSASNPSSTQALGSREATNSKAQNEVLVPASPKRRPRQDLPPSPSRVLLGIDKGLRASDVSLRRPPQNRGSASYDFGSIARGRNVQSAQDVRSTTRSFSDRIKDLKSNEKTRQEKQDLVSKSRSKNFGLKNDELAQYRKAAEDLPPPSHGYVAPREVNFGRDAILKGRAMETEKADESNLKPGYSFESYSATHLSKRIIPHTTLARTFTDKKTFTIPDVLRVVKSPDYEPPDIVEDWVVFGIIASKSSPYDHKDKDDGSNAGKFMVIHLTDLKWELDLFLFGTGFTRFWKLTPGTLIAVLNPGILPPPPGKKDTGKFSLSLNSSEDTVLEIGAARDSGFCKSIKRDGQQCTQWVDVRHTEYCEFHVDLRVQKARANRMEVNTMSSSTAPGGGGQKQRDGHFEGNRKYKPQQKPNNAPFADRPERFGGAGGTIHISDSRVTGRSSASLFDDDDVDPDSFHRGTTKDERLQRRLAQREKEKNIAKQLGGIRRGGIGAAYLKQSSEDKVQALQTNESSQKRASDVPVMTNRVAKDVQLSPIKRKRLGSSDVSNGTLTKKTRFITTRGIKEAGRDSIGEVQALNMSDDDDGLDIVM